MKLEGLHHITAITGDAPRNVDFYVRVLGLRLVKKTVNQDDPTVYHLFYGDEEGSPGLDLTFFEYPGATRGRPGAGMVHRVVWRVGSDDAIAFWQERLAAEGVETLLDGGRLRFADPEGLEHELVVSTVPDAPLVAAHPDVSPEHALQGFDGVRAYSRSPEASAALLTETLGFEQRDDGYEVRGDARGSLYAYDAPPAEPAIQGAGTIHHVAWAAVREEEEAWQRRVAEAGFRPTPVVERFYFQSVYFREPSGVLFEIATIGPGFTVDEPLQSLGERLSLPPAFEHLRGRVEPMLTPLPDLRSLRTRA